MCDLTGPVVQKHLICWNESQYRSFRCCPLACHRKLDWRAVFLKFIWNLTCPAIGDICTHVKMVWAFFSHVVPGLCILFEHESSIRLSYSAAVGTQRFQSGPCFSVDALKWENQPVTNVSLLKSFETEHACFNDSHYCQLLYKLVWTLTIMFTV